MPLFSRTPIVDRWIWWRLLGADTFAFLVLFMALSGYLHHEWLAAYPLCWYAVGLVEYFWKKGT